MMTQEQVRELHVGDEVLHATSGMRRKVVEIRSGRHVVLAPKLRGKGTAHINMAQFASTHSMPPPGRTSVSKEDLEIIEHGELYFAARMIVTLRQKGEIPVCAPRAEAYLRLLAAQFGEDIA